MIRYIIRGTGTLRSVKRGKGAENELNCRYVFSDDPQTMML